MAVPMPDLAFSRAGSPISSPDSSPDSPDAHHSAAVPEARDTPAAGGGGRFPDGGPGGGHYTAAGKRPPKALPGICPLGMAAKTPVHSQEIPPAYALRPAQWPRYHRDPGELQS